LHEFLCSHHLKSIMTHCNHQSLLASRTQLAVQQMLGSAIQIPIHAQY